MIPENLRFAEWLEPDGLGGFASGTVSGVRTRRYHALLNVATRPPTGRMVLCNGFEAWVELDGRTIAITTQHYSPNVLHPDGWSRIAEFRREPWPTWVFDLGGGLRLEQEIFARHGTALLCIAWRLSGRRQGVTLAVRPLLSGRDHHNTHRENAAMRFHADQADGRVRWKMYPDVPGVTLLANALYSHEPTWYRAFRYAEESSRGLDDIEDCAAPGVLRFNLGDGEAALLLAAEGEAADLLDKELDAQSALRRLRSEEQARREKLGSPLQRAADGYIVRRGGGNTIIAGYPWFTDWGRDTFISMRGLCLASGRLDLAERILLEWSGQVSQGMLPNHFPDSDAPAEFNSVDAPLWYVVAVHDYFEALQRAGLKPAAAKRKRLVAAVDAILTGYAAGTRYRIHADEDGLIAAGVPGVQLTWMDAKVDDWVVTPRIGKPVEIQALWLNALRIGGTFDARWQKLEQRGTQAFAERFWNAADGWLYDVVDVDHESGHNDPACRPNQLFAIGGLPFAILEGERARRVVDVCEQRLWTSLGPRSLAPGSPGYRPIYIGDRVARDGAYHQGTVWPWLSGAFVEAWLRVRGMTQDAKAEARRRFIEPLIRHLDEAGLGHVSEIADGDAPHTPRGCPFQAWSVAELLRIELVVLGQRAEPPSAAPASASRPMAAPAEKAARETSAAPKSRARSAASKAETAAPKPRTRKPRGD